MSCINRQNAWALASVIAACAGEVPDGVDGPVGHAEEALTYAKTIFFETATFSEFPVEEGTASIVTSPVREGRYAAKYTATGARSESKTGRFKRDTEYWFGWSIYVPPEFSNTSSQTVSQLAGYQPPCHTGANLHVKIRNGQWGLWKRHMGTVTGDVYNLAPVRKGRWTDLVVHAKFTPRSDGFLRFWVDGQKVHDVAGSTFVNCPHGPYFKAGLYAGAPRGAFLFVDEFRAAEGNVGYDAVVPRGSSAPGYAGGTTDAGAASDGGGSELPLEVEAEAFQLTAPFTVRSDASASGGRAIEVASGMQSTRSVPSTGRARHSFRVMRSGTYAIWGRVRAPNTGSDSFWVRVNDGTWVKWNGIPTGSGYRWSRVHDSDANARPTTYALSAGEHAVEFAYREGGTRLDRVALTDVDSTPSP